MFLNRKYKNYYKEYQYDGGFTEEPSIKSGKTLIMPKQREIIYMQWTVKLKKNECCIPCIRSRSMLTFMVQPTIIDYGYKGKYIRVVAYNMTDEPHEFTSEMVQLVIFKIPKIKGGGKKRE